MYYVSLIKQPWLIPNMIITNQPKQIKSFHGEKPKFKLKVWPNVLSDVTTVTFPQVNILNIATLSFVSVYIRELYLLYVDLYLKKVFSIILQIPEVQWKY